MPDLVGINSTQEKQEEKPPENNNVAPTQPETEASGKEVEEHTTEPVAQVKVKTVAEDEKYAKYFKMLKMGVPLQVPYMYKTQYVCVQHGKVVFISMIPNKATTETFPRPPG